MNIHSDALLRDENDPLRSFRDRFAIPKDIQSYFAGSSLGPMPRSAREFVETAMQGWESGGVDAYFQPPHSYVSYADRAKKSLSSLLGASPDEVCAMGSLTGNLHTMLVSFFRPTQQRYAIVMEARPFPSDRYAVLSHLEWHGIDPSRGLIEWQPRETGEWHEEDLTALLRARGESIALVLLGNPHYVTGQAFNMKPITDAAHSMGCLVGWDLAHGAGNLTLELHDSGADFAVWCSYKYLNGGPGSTGGLFVHTKHFDSQLPHLKGWFGHKLETRFQMPCDFVPERGASAWQFSMPPVLSLAGLLASLAVFDEAGVDRLYAKRDQISHYLEALLTEHASHVGKIITPKVRGAQVSMLLREAPGPDYLPALRAKGILCDVRDQRILRLTPAPLYSRYVDAARAAEAVATTALN